MSIVGREGVGRGMVGGRCREVGAGLVVSRKYCFWDFEVDLFMSVMLDIVN